MMTKDRPFMCAQYKAVCIERWEKGRKGGRDGTVCSSGFITSLCIAAPCVPSILSNRHAFRRVCRFVSVQSVHLVLRHHRHSSCCPRLLAPFSSLPAITMSAVVVSGSAALCLDAWTTPMPARARTPWPASSRRHMLVRRTVSWTLCTHTHTHIAFVRIACQTTVGHYIHTEPRTV
ncbi:hypothetical protein BC831DRAFT_258272 [Entophlyctis helioformis]|nr:hypothetical protein BC831DRAFT_258272 [Entophlyctis helioformis]